MKNIPTHDPQTGELNPYYEELTGKPNPDLKQGDGIISADISDALSCPTGAIGDKGEPGDAGIKYAGDTETLRSSYIRADLSYRMYGLVPYNISPIQQGIQFGHAVVEYGISNKAKKPTYEYKQWAEKDKTFVILNGGTTNKNMTRIGTNNGIPKGTLNQHLEYLKSLKVKFATFYEPDLGDQLTAIAFIVDDRVYDYEKYQNYEDFYSLEKKNYNDYYQDLFGLDWQYVVDLRQFLSNFKLA